jgi:hypothetical protein
MNFISHPRFDFPSFSKLFTLSELRERASERAFLMPSGPIITSPVHLNVVELLRREVLGPAVPVGAVPVDAFVFGSGEPPAPYLTKIGGAPYRSRKKTWPTTKDGRPLGFVGQLSFLDSADLMPSTPGDVLLIFVDPENQFSKDDYTFEWVSLAEDEPISRGEMPSVTYTHKPGRMAQRRGAVPETRPFAPFVCHGAIHRTYDFPGQDALFAAYREGHRVSVLEATKIGGIPHFIQKTPSVEGRFVGALASVQPAPEVPYPWANDEAPVSLSARTAIPTWRFGDMGSLFFFERGDAVVLEAQSY